MNQKEVNIFVESFANINGLNKQQVLDWILEAFSHYAAKTLSNNKGNYVTKVEGDRFVTYRQWDLVADDIVMEDPDTQWRVLDAVDEGFDDAEPGYCVQVEVKEVERTRQFKTWIKQFILRKMR